MATPSLPIVVIGAGPVGLAAAAHLLARGLEPLVLEAGERVGTHLRAWGHVQMFTPWRYVVDRASAALLARQGWQAPDLESFPTGGELSRLYLEPLAACPELAARVRLEVRVEAVARQGHDRLKTAGRAAAPFLVRVSTPAGEEELLARAVIDASGTFANPNWLGASGLPAAGERAAQARIAYGLPDVRGRQRGRFAGRRVLVVGAGHSALNVLQDLLALQDEVAATEVLWALRRAELGNVFGGGEKDQLAARGELGERLRRLLAAGRVELFTGVAIDRVELAECGVRVASGERLLPWVDEIVAATGFRPDLALASELRLGLDPVTQAPVALAPLIDPNLHSCGTVRPHGAAELAHPEEGFYVVGMKSYGRAPTFLLLTGYEQVRSVAAALAGDWAAARRVELVLPETGVCVLGDVKERVVAGLGSCCGAAAASAAAGEPRREACCEPTCCGGARGRAA